MGRRLLSRPAVQHRVQQPARRRHVGRRAALDHAADSVGEDHHGRSRSFDRGAHEGAHDVQGRRLRRDPRRVRPDARQGRDARVPRRRCAAHVLRTPGHGRSRSRREAPDARLLLDELLAAEGEALLGHAERLRRVRVLHAQSVEPRQAAAHAGQDGAGRPDQDRARHERSRRDRARYFGRTAQGLARSRDRRRRAVSLEARLRAAALHQLGAIDAARGGRVRRQRQPRRVRDRSRDRQGRGGRVARPRADGHEGDHRRQRDGHARTAGRGDQGQAVPDREARR